MTNILILSGGFFGLAALAAAVWVVLAMPHAIREAVTNYLAAEDTATEDELRRELEETHGYLEEANSELKARSTSRLALENQDLRLKLDRLHAIHGIGRRPNLDDPAQEKRAGDL